jgi:hypothetical protein
LVATCWLWCSLALIWDVDNQRTRSPTAIALERPPRFIISTHTHTHTCSLERCVEQLFALCCGRCCKLQCVMETACASVPLDERQRDLELPSQHSGLATCGAHHAAAHRRVPAHARHAVVAAARSGANRLTRQIERHRRRRRLVGARRTAHSRQSTHTHTHTHTCACFTC